MQNEHRVDNMEKLSDEKDNLHQPEKNSETSNTNTRMNPSKDLPKENEDIVNNENISASANGEKIASLSSEIIPESSQDKDHLDDKDHDNENKGRDGNESKNNENDENEENNKNMEMAATPNVDESYTKVGISRIEEEEEQETTNPIPPPKPPRLRSGSVEDTGNEKESSKENEEEEKEKDDEEMKMSNEQISSLNTARKSVSTISRKTIEAIENSIEKVEEEHAEELEKAEIDSTQDDADVVQSPPPRTGKTVICSFQKLHKNSPYEIEFIFFEINY